MLKLLHLHNVLIISLTAGFITSLHAVIVVLLVANLFRISAGTIPLGVKCISLSSLEVREAMR